MRSKPTITIKCANRDCKEVLREDVLIAAKDSEPPIERDNAGWYPARRQSPSTLRQAGQGDRRQGAGCCQVAAGDASEG